MNNHINEQKIIVIVPAYNESGNIGSVVRDIQTHLPFADIVVINDGSDDDTHLVASLSGALVLDLPYNLGIGGSVQTGYQYAALHDYDYAIRIDGDGQHDPAEVPQMINEMIQTKSDMIIGSRFLHKQGYQSTKLRKLGIHILSRFVYWMTGNRSTDPTSGYRICTKKLISIFAEHHPDDYPEVESLIMMRQFGLQFKETPVKMRPRGAGISSISHVKSMYYMVKVILAVFIMGTKKREKVETMP